MASVYFARKSADGKRFRAFRTYQNGHYKAYEFGYGLLSSLDIQWAVMFAGSRTTPVEADVYDIQSALDAWRLRCHQAGFVDEIRWQQ